MSSWNHFHEAGCVLQRCGENTDNLAQNPSLKLLQLLNHDTMQVQILLSMRCSHLRRWYTIRISLPVPRLSAGVSLRERGGGDAGISRYNLQCKFTSGLSTNSLSVERNSRASKQIPRARPLLVPLPRHTQLRNFKTSSHEF